MKEFIWKDKSGRGFTNKLYDVDLLKIENEQDWNDIFLHEFAEESEIGDVWENNTSTITCSRTN